MPPPPPPPKKKKTAGNNISRKSFSNLSYGGNMSKPAFLDPAPGKLHLLSAVEPMQVPLYATGCLDWTPSSVPRWKV